MVNHLETYKQGQSSNAFIFDTKSSLPVLLILIAEFFERFAYYSIKGILFIYLISYFGYSREEGVAYVHLFIFASYIFTLAGGVLADRVFGRICTIVLFMLFYCCGLIFLFGSSVVQSRRILHLGLFFISVSAGCMKPSVSSLGGDLFEVSERKHLNSFFIAFYFAINISSALAIFGMPLIVDRPCFNRNSCYALGFSLSFLSLFSAFISFLCVPIIQYILSGRNTKQYKYSKKKSLLHEENISSENNLNIASNEYKIDIDIYNNCTQKKKVKYHSDGLTSIVKKILPISIGWMLHDQQSSTWVDQAGKLDKSISFFGSTIVFSSTQTQVLNSALLLIILPFFGKITRKTLSFFSLPDTLQHRIIYGMFLFSFAFLFSSFLETYILFFSGVSILAQIPQIIFITLGEALVGSTGLSFSYKMAPSAHKTLVLAFWYANMAIGNFLVFSMTWIFRLFNIPSFAQSFIYLFLCTITVVYMYMSLLNEDSIHNNTTSNSITNNN